MQRTATLTCEYFFEASHQLRRDDWSDAQNEEVYGQCVRLHGHSYRLVVMLRGPVDDATGMVINFRDVKEVVSARILSRLDHRHLNDVVADLTTAENICWWIARELYEDLGPHLHRLELWETRTCGAGLGPDDLDLLKAILPLREVV